MPKTTANFAPFILKDDLTNGDVQWRKCWKMQRSDRDNRLNKWYGVPEEDAAKE